MGDIKMKKGDAWLEFGVECPYCGHVECGLNETEIDTYHEEISHGNEGVVFCGYCGKEFLIDMP